MARKKFIEWPNLDGFSSRASWIRCLKVIWRELGASGLPDDEALLPYQRKILSDLDDGLDEVALAELHEYWNYDLSRLMDRGRPYHPNEPAKPRIELSIELTSHGNLKAEWYPEGYNLWGRTGDSDFAWFWRAEHRGGGWDSRPSNEFFFIHGVDHAKGKLLFGDSDDRPACQLDQVLLRGCTALWGDLKRRLDRHFEVRLMTDIFEEFVDIDDGSWFGRDQLVKWEIDSPERRQQEEELAEYRSIEQRLGFSIEQFEEVWAECLRKKGTGPAPNEYTAAPKAAKMLRELGHSVTKRDVERLRYLIGKHGPKAGEVIPFEKVDS